MSAENPGGNMVRMFKGNARLASATRSGTTWQGATAGAVMGGERMAEPRLGSDSVLFVTLDSCRYDTFRDAHTPMLDRVGPLHAGLAPSHFTYGSHAAMFMGFTPIVTNDPVPLLNPKFAKLFKLRGPGFSKGAEAFEVAGRDIVDGFRNEGYAVYGSGAMSWFSPDELPATNLIASFQDFFYPGDPWSGSRQVAWLLDRAARHASGKVFAFLNLGETHVPYWHPGAEWSRDDNPCVPFQTDDRRADCVRRQRACLEYLDTILSPLVDAFADGTILVCGDHGDCWGEDGLWEHGISHPMTLTVPVLMRLRGQPIGPASLAVPS